MPSTEAEYTKSWGSRQKLGYTGPVGHDQKSEFYSDGPQTLSKESEIGILDFAPHLDESHKLPACWHLHFFHRIEELQHYELPRSSWIVTVSYTDLYIHLHLGKNVNSLWQTLASITEKTPGCRLEVPMFITGQEIFAYKAMHPGLSLTPSKRLVLTSTQARDNILENFYLHTNISSPPPNLSLLSN